MKGVTEFLDQVQNDPGFIERAKAYASDEERRAFLRDEGFEFAPEELEAAISSWAFFDGKGQVRKTKELRKDKRYDVFLKITEINGQPLTDAVMLDISAWGIKIESLIQLAPDSPVEFSFLLPGEGGKKKFRLSGEVVWAGQVPFSKRYQTGLRLFKSIEEMHHEGKFPLNQVKSAIRKQAEEISNKEFLSIREFANKIGVHWFTVWRWTVENKITFKQVKSGCKILIPASELSQFQSTSL